MSTDQHDADAYGQELARIGRARAPQRGPRCSGPGRHRGRARADGRARGAAGGRGGRRGAHLDLREQRPHGFEPCFEDGWDEGVRAVAGDLLCIADTTTAQRGRATSNAQLLAHLRQPASPAPTLPAQEPAPAPAAALDAAPDAMEVLTATQRCTWALADPGDLLSSEASEEILTVALSAVREDERLGTPSAWRRSPTGTGGAFRSCCARTGRAASPPRTPGTCWPASPRGFVSR
ncbi:hypothetical protein [Streptomyces sp. NPDC002587]